MARPKHRPVFAPGQRPKPVPPPPTPIAWSRHRFLVRGVLEVLSAMHIGTGNVLEPITAMRHDNHAEIPEVAAIMRDDSGHPYLPGTALKGLLRRLGEAVLNEQQVTALFGTIKNDTSGAMGALFVRGATQVAPGDATGMPYVAQAAARLGEGVFISTQTAIDSGSGTAAHGKLFSKEMVAPGARFGFSLLLETLPGRTEQDAKALLDCVASVLNELRSCAGQTIGAGQSDGQGRVRLEAPPVFERLVMQADGKLHPSRPGPPALSPLTRASLPTWHFTLRCEGPFLIADSSRKPVPTKPGHARRHPSVASTAPLSAQCQGMSPLVLGASVMGALRARAAWICALQSHRGSNVVATIGADGMSPLDRLFGTTGFRALLSLQALDVLGGEKWNYTSVKLDRFSGAPIDQALFGTEAFIGVTLRLTLTLTRRGVAGGPGVPSAADRRLVEELAADLARNGLMLGHGVNRGYGWFGCDSWRAEA